MAMVLRAGLYLQLAAAVMKWQVAQGRYVLYEHPAPAKSWEEECTKELVEMPNMSTTVCDQCQYGLNVDGTGLNRKPTRWMTNMEELIPFLSRRCKKRHFHTPLQGSNRTRAAQQHPKALCRDIVQGILTHLSKEHNYILEAYVFEEDEEMEDVPQGPAEEGDALELPGEAPGESQP
jgi:hypothetical protein